jgi:hypothetical protein
MTFKTQADIWRALLDGKKVKHYIWADGSFVYLECGFVRDEKGENLAFYAVKPDEWSIYEPPKQKRKVSRYRFTNLETGEIVDSSSYYSDEGFFTSDLSSKGFIFEDNYLREKIGEEIEVDW